MTLLEIDPQSIVNFVTLKEVGIAGILLALLFWGYKYFSERIEKLEEKLDERDKEVKELIEKYNEKIDELRDKHETELKELRREQSGIIEKISTLISENTRILQEVSVELTIKQRTNGKSV